MKILKRNLKEGRITVKIETLDDLWHLYNTVVSGDRVIARTTRRIRVGSEDDRKQESVRKPMTLVIQVENVSFHNFSNRVRIKGKILDGPTDLISIGSYHTINIEMGNTLTIIKDHWPRYLLDRLKNAEKSGTSPIALLVTIEDGTAEILLAADFGIREVVRIRTNISRKRGDQKSYDASMREFFQEVVVGVRTALEQNNIGLIVICGPGFVKDHFHDFLKSMRIKGLPPVAVEATNTTGIPAAKEILYKGVISRTLSDLKIETETQLVEEVLTHIAKDDGLATYGDAEVAKAAQYGAIEHLLITDKKLRGAEDDKRRWLDRVIKDTEKAAGKLHIVSTEHPAGDQLDHISGIAAILRFKINQ
ncbi:MAG: mRNA surveillance protein pelota [Candidatus Thorarchaeota archaeon]